MLRLYNSMTRSKQVFRPREGGKLVKIFTCGPSTYRRPHIGNYRSFLYEDILVRYLEYSGYEVERVINFTDVEDKSLAEALSQGSTVDKITGDVAEHFYKETAQLKIKLPPDIPRSSTSVDQAAYLIKKLIEKGYAYWHKGDVFFDPLNFKGFGKLFRLDMSRWPKTKVHFKKDTYDGRRWNLGDFILWHGDENRNHEIHAKAAWDTEIGRGRPSWNIQDPAIITKHLGYTVDINCGGIDNIYRHHDYNLAIIESLSGHEYSNFYLHGEHLVVAGKPMSKSRGNILYPEGIFKQGCKLYHLRFFLSFTHYREKLNFTPKNMEVSSRLVDSLRQTVKELLDLKQPAEVSEEKHESEINPLIERIEKLFRIGMDDDLSLGKAVNNILPVLKELSNIKKRGQLTLKDTAGIERALKRVDSVLQVLF